MADYFVLTGEERKLLQGLLDKSRGGSSNRGFSSTQIDRGLGTYIAKPVEVTGSVEPGIPPREDDVPGRAACNIYRIILDGTGEPSLVQASDIELQYVYNISTSTISQDWVLVHQDMYGDWIASSSMGLAIGTLSADLTYGGTADVAVVEGTSPSGGSATGETLTDCWTYLLLSTEKLSSGFHVEVDRSSKRIIAYRECPVTA